MAFDAKRAATSAVDFITSELVGRLGVSGIAVGYDFHFGKGRAGSPTLLQSEGARLGIPVHVEKRHETHGITVSSGLDPRRAQSGPCRSRGHDARLPLVREREVRHGDKRGRDLGYPTANLALDPACGLRHGIYAVRVGGAASVMTAWRASARRRCSTMARRCWKCICSIFQATSMARRWMSPSSAFLRDEMKFDSLEALVAQMDVDSAAARAALGADPEALFPALGEIDAG